MIGVNRSQFATFFSKTAKNIKISWRAAIRKNKSLSASYIKTGDSSSFLDAFNLSELNHIAVIHLGVFSSGANFDLLLKDLPGSDNLTVAQFKSCPVLTVLASQQLNSLFPREYALLTASTPFIIVKTSSESSWLSLINRVLNVEDEQIASNSSGGVSLLLIRNRSILIDMRNNENSKGFRVLFKNFKKKDELYAAILRMLGAKLIMSFDWIRRFF